MTVSSTTDRATFPGNGVAQIFPLPFRFFANSDIQVWLVTNATGVLTPQTIGVHYTLAGANDPEVDGSPTSSLTMLTAPTALQSLFVQRVVPLTQPTDLINQGRFFPETHENVFDRLTMQLQQAVGESKGAIRVAIGDPEPARLPNAISRALQLMAFDSLGNPVTAIPASGSAIDLALNLLNATDPAKGAAMVGYIGQTVYDALLSGTPLAGLDATGTTDISATLQAALNARRVVVLPAGDFKLSAKITLNSKNVLVGQGMEATRVFRDTAVAPFDMFEIISKNDVAIGGMWLDNVQKEVVTDGTKRRAAIRAWDNGTLVKCNRLRFKGLRFTYFTNAEVQPEGTRGVIGLEQCSDVDVSHCKFEDNRATCIYWWNSDNIRVHDNYCLGEQTPYDPFGRLGSFTSGLASGVTVADNRISDTGYTSINVSGQGVVVSGNVIRSPALSGVTIAELLPAATDVAVSGNSIYNPGIDGISVFEVNGAVISGNTVRGALGTARAAVHLYNTAAGNVPLNVHISGNTLIGNTAGIRQRAGQWVTSSANLMKENGMGILIKNISAMPSSLVSKSDVFADNTNYAAQLETPTTAQSLTVSGADIYSSDIATKQATGLVCQDALSTLNLGGGNSFSPNYSTLFVETSFGSRATKGFLSLAGNLVTYRAVDGIPYGATLAFDPPSLVDGSGANASVTVAGLVVGDFVKASFSVPLPGGMLLSAEVTAANTVTVRFQNESGATVDLASGTITVVGRKP